MSIGQQLQEARARKGVSIQKAAEETKVRSDVLEALEADDYSGMAAPVYTKGFLKIYAQYLGLDPQAVRNQYEQSQHKTAPVAPLHAAATHLHQSPVDKLISSVTTMWKIWALAGAILVVLVLIVSIVISSTRGIRNSLPEHPAPAVTPATLPVHAVPATSPDAYIKPSQPNAGLLDLGKTNAVAPVLTAPLTLSVRLAEDSWIEVIVDGKRLPYHTQKAGWSKEWPAQKSIVLKAGNAGGVRATLNGQELGSLGRHGQSITRTFPR